MVIVMENEEKPEISHEQIDLMEGEMFVAAAEALGSGKFIDPFISGGDYIDPVGIVFEAFTSVSRVKNEWEKSFKVSHSGSAEIVASAIWAKTFNISPHNLEEHSPRCVGGIPIIAFANAMKIMSLRGEIESSLNKMNDCRVDNDHSLEQSINCVNEYKNKHTRNKTTE
jgi:hypothetical protein